MSANASSKTQFSIFKFYIFQKLYSMWEDLNEMEIQYKWEKYLGKTLTVPDKRRN